jgi:hypothetical protein
MFEIYEEKLGVKLTTFVFHEYVTQQDGIKKKKKTIKIKGYLFKYGWLDTINLSFPLNLKCGITKRNRKQHTIYTHSTVTL